MANRLLSSGLASSYSGNQELDRKFDDALTNLQHTFIDPEPGRAVALGPGVAHLTRAFPDESQRRWNLGEGRLQLDEVERLQPRIPGKRPDAL
jgi:hypothetical protein